MKTVYKHHKSHYEHLEKVHENDRKHYQMMSIFKVCARGGITVEEFRKKSPVDQTTFMTKYGDHNYDRS